MPILDQRTVNVTRTLAILALAVAFIYGARHTLLAFLMAIFFAYIVGPIVSRVERWHRISRGSRKLAIAEVYVVLALVIAGIVLGIGPGIADDGRRLLSAAPALLEKLGSGEIVHKIGSTRGWSYQTQMHAEHFLAEHRDALLAALRNFGIEVGAVLTQSFWILLIPILAIPFLNDAPEIVEFVFRILRPNPQARTFAEAVLQDVNSMAANYIRAQLLLAGFAVVAYTVVLAASGVQYGVVLGITAGILEFIPLVGPLIGAIAILAVAFLTGFEHLWLLVLFLGCWRLLQDYFNSPRLMHERVKLHPFIIIFSILAGGEIAGVLGVFLSIPVAATVQIIWRCWRTYYERRTLSANPRDSQPRAA